MTRLAPTLQAYFTTRLTGELGASPHTVAGYRDTWRLLLRFAALTRGWQPQQLDLDQLDAALVSDFLTHLETDRGNSIRTRNARLAAIHSSTATPPCATPSTQPRSPASWTSRPSVTTAPT